MPIPADGGISVKHEDMAFFDQWHQSIDQMMLPDGNTTKIQVHELVSAVGYLMCSVGTKEDVQDIL